MSFLSFSKADAPMPFAKCPKCGHQLQYTPEMSGVAGICPACSAEVVCQQTPWQIACTIAVAIVAVLSLAGLGYLGLIGVTVGLPGYAVVIIFVAMLAFAFAIRLRTILPLLALFLGAVIVGAIMAAANLDWRSYASKKRADAAIASPFFASLSIGLPVGGSGRSHL